MWVRCVAVCGLLLAACGRINFDTSNDASNPFGMVSLGCEPPPAPQAFGDGVQPCVPWGMLYNNNSNVSETNGELVVTPPPDTMFAGGGCESEPIEFGPAGIVAKLNDTVQGQSVLGLADSASGRQAAVWITREDSGMPGTGQHELIAVSGLEGMLDEHHVTDKTLFDPGAPLWVRIRPSPDGTAVWWEHGVTGSSWTLYARQVTTPPAMVRIQIGGSEVIAVPAPGQVRVDSVNVCP